MPDSAAAICSDDRAPRGVRRRGGRHLLGGGRAVDRRTGLAGNYGIPYVTWRRFSPASRLSHGAILDQTVPPPMDKLLRL